MAQYQNILVAVDLSEESSSVIDRARQIAQAGTQLHLIHVIEPLSFAYGGDIPMDFSGIQDEIHEQASAQLKRFAQSHDIEPARQHLLLGKPDVEIQALAEELDADLIVVGSHGRSGLALLMGSTANGVLHGAKRDVLAVRIGK
ncbi:MAG: universal stress protein [Gammaproteobacteria bacterium]|jgi:universal stress protein A|nr:universal stress protein [Gammaproteobacteria bacterium]